MTRLDTQMFELNAKVKQSQIELATPIVGKVPAYKVNGESVSHKLVKHKTRVETYNLLETLWKLQRLVKHKEKSRHTIY